MIDIVFIGTFVGVATLLFANYILEVETVKGYIKKRCSELSINISKTSFFYPLYDKLTKGEQLSKSMLSPNGITTIRTGMALTSILIYHYTKSPLPIYLYVFASVLDAVDGMVAVKCWLATEFGKIFDPFCDKLCYLAPIVYFNYTSYLSYILVTTELIGQFGVRWYLLKKGKDGAAIMTGKIKASLCFSSAVYFFLLDLGMPIPNFTSPLLIICIILSIASSFFKIRANFEIKYQRYYADTLSVFNLFCGGVGIWFSIKKFFSLTFIAIICGEFFDLFDGMMARFHGGTKYGEWWDNGADFVSFGVCPCVMIISKHITWNLLRTNIEQRAIFIMAILYCSSIFFRLMRYVKVDKKIKDRDDRIFVGLPSPGSATIVLGATILFKGMLLRFVLIATTILTVSKLKFIHFGKVIIKKYRRLSVFGGAIACVAAAYTIKNHNSLILPWLFFIGGIFYLIIGKLIKLEKSEN